jgi:hypothetical protein
MLITNIKPLETGTGLITHKISEPALGESGPFRYRDNVLILIER